MVAHDASAWASTRSSSGYHATIAAGLFEAQGFTPIVLSENGVPAVLQARQRQQA